MPETPVNGLIPAQGASHHSVKPKFPAPCKQDAGQVLVFGRLRKQARPGLAQTGFGLAPLPAVP